MHKIDTFVFKTVHFRSNAGKVLVVFQLRSKISGKSEVVKALFTTS